MTGSRLRDFILWLFVAGTAASALGSVFHHTTAIYQTPRP